MQQTDKRNSYAQDPQVDQDSQYHRGLLSDGCYQHEV